MLHKEKPQPLERIAAIFDAVFTSAIISPFRFGSNSESRNMKNSTAIINNRPPSNALRVEAWRDLPKDGAAARYKITREDGGVSVIMLAKGNRIILDALLRQPVYCASPVRVSNRDCILIHKYGVPITLEMYQNDEETGRDKFGVYFLNGHVLRLDGDGGAT